MSKTVVNAKVTIIKKADGWWVRCPDGSLRGKSDTVHGATVWAERNGYKDWTVEHRMGNAIRSKDRVVNGALRHVAENAWFCKDEEVLYKGKPAVVRSILPGGVYMVEVGGQRLRARGNELSAPWTNSKACNKTCNKGCNKTCNAKFKVGDFVKAKDHFTGSFPAYQGHALGDRAYKVKKVDQDGDVMLEGFMDVWVSERSLVKNEYPRAAANGTGPNGWDAKQCAAALKGATDEQVKIAASDPRNPLLQKCARVEARSRGIVINADASGDDGKCTTCEFGCYKRPNMSCKRGYDPKIANGKCKYWCADSMTKAVRNMSTQQAISSVEMLLGSDDPMDHDEALAILQHHRSDIEREVGGWQYRDLYRRANNAKAKKA